MIIWEEAEFEETTDCSAYIVCTFLLCANLNLSATENLTIRVQWRKQQSYYRAVGVKSFLSHGRRYRQNVDVNAGVSELTELCTFAIFVFSK